MAQVDRPVAVSRPVRIFFGADVEDLLHLTTALQSLLSLAEAGHRYEITVITQALRQDAADMLTSMAEEKEHVSLRVLPIDDLTAAVPARLKEKGRFSLAAWGPFFVPFLTEGWVFWASPECVFLEDPSVLLLEEKGQKLAAAVGDARVDGRQDPAFLRHAEKVLGKDRASAYFHPAVMLLDADAIWKEYSLEAMLEQAEGRGGARMAQDGLNRVFSGKVHLLDARWNTNWLEAEENLPSEEAAAPPAVIRFSGAMKPWHMEGRLHRASRHFWKHAEASPVADAVRLMYEEDCRKAVKDYARQCKRYLRLLLLSKVTWGETRRFYQEKTVASRALLKATLDLMNGVRGNDII